MDFVNEAFISRAYQEEIFSQACSENIIAALSTGSGKTFIAALLIKWVMAQPLSVGKKAIFLVPNVPLVDQQRDFLAMQTPMEVRGYKGAMGVDSWDKFRWEDEFRAADCLVMTAQIFKNVLIHGFWSLELVSLVVFDECHHARDDHPYRMIMTDFYDDCANKPKIFGMTASPISDPRNHRKSIQALERNLYARVLAVREHAAELELHTNKPEEVLLKYCLSSVYPHQTQPSLWDELQEACLEPESSLVGVRVRYETVRSAVGPVAANYFLVMMIKNISADISMALNENLSDEELEYRRKQAGEMKARASLTEQRLAEHLLQDSELSPKLAKLISLLSRYKSESFCGVVFVEQRQVALMLSWSMSRRLELSSWIRSGVLTGHADSSSNGNNIAGMTVKAQKEVLLALKNRSINLLFATSVAEEGLDIPACDLVICFDPPKTQRGYIQTRGRARQRKSTYVIMIEDGNDLDLKRYEKFRALEQSFDTEFLTSHNTNGGSPPLIDSAAEDEEEEEDPQDVALRESYIVRSTGATLTYSSAIAILDHLCALIPRDAYTSALRPIYEGEFQVTVRLPFAIPLPAEYQVIPGKPRRTKKEAKKSAAFCAARILHKLGVLDDHLLPTKSRSARVIEDADDRKIESFDSVSDMMDVMVASPWRAGPPWFLYVVQVNASTSAGLISGHPFPGVSIVYRGQHVDMHCHQNHIISHIDDNQLQLLDSFTKCGIWWNVTASPLQASPSCFLCPLDEHLKIDWAAMEEVASNKIGVYDWDSIREEDEGCVMLMNERKYGRPLRFLRFRSDLTMESRPPVTDDDTHFNTFAEYFEHEHSVKASKREKKLFEGRPPAGRLLEVVPWARWPSSNYSSLYGTSKKTTTMQGEKTQPPFLLPESFCRRALLSKPLLDAFHVFAPLCQRICDVFRSQTIQQHLLLPPMTADLVIEATTIPAAMANFNNQRLETMGDSVLKLGVITYIFNRFPQKHEGQLEAIKSNSVCNRFLFTRARAIELERFISCENRINRAWFFTLPEASEASDWITLAGTIPCVKRNFARRSLQDCMEAILGAAYICGGIDHALRAGDALGLCFGGSRPWRDRYEPAKNVPPAPLFTTLQQELGYTFTNGALLVEAVKHPSFDAEGGPSYQRLEFLGDAVIELVVTTYLFNKYRDATSGTLSWVRARAICNTTLGAVAVKRLSLHKYLLANSVLLFKELSKEVPLLSEASYDDLVVNGWRYDPPKVLADIFEGLVGAMFVDSGHDYLRVAGIIENIMEDVLVRLNEDIPKDPTSMLLQWTAKAGCRNVKFMKSKATLQHTSEASIAFVVHDQTVAGPLSASNKCRAKGLVAEAALAVLSDPKSEFALSQICTCGKASEENRTIDVGDERIGGDEMTLRDVRERKLDDETLNGCALTGALRIAEDEADAWSDILTLTFNWDWDEDEEEDEDLGRSTVRVERINEYEEEIDDVQSVISDGSDLRMEPALSQASMLEVELLLYEDEDIDMEDHDV